MSDDSETFFIRFRVIDTTSDQDLRSITQKLRPTERFLIRLLAEGSKLVDELSYAMINYEPNQRSGACWTIELIDNKQAKHRIEFLVKLISRQFSTADYQPNGTINSSCVSCDSLEKRCTCAF